MSSRLAVRALIIEDSDRLRRSLVHGLERVGWTVDAVPDGSEGLGFVESYDYDVVVLDLMLPGLSGLEVLERLRRSGSLVHVLILSARDRVEDRVRGLELGADDYLVKPFSFDELCARLQALVRRRYQSKDPRVELGDVEIDTSAKRALRAGQQIHLTPSEYALLELLVMRRGRVISQSQIIGHLHSHHTGLGLTLVATLCRVLGYSIDSRLGPDGLLTVEVAGPQSPGHRGTAAGPA